MLDPKIINNLIDAIRASEKKIQPYDSEAEVVRVEDGIAWVHIPGGVDETPAIIGTSASPGDTVRVRVANGQAWILGNETSPATDDTTAIAARTVAQTAEKTAEDAVNVADQALQDAEIAHEAATSAQASATAAATAASSAQASADNASEYAARALGNLSTVQSVAETLNWITEHGTMTLTTDTELNPAHVYFVQNATGDYVVGGTHYSVVTEPSVSDLANYYELNIDESLTNYVGTHLAVTDEGLWVLPATTGYKVLIATGNGTTYTEAGTYIINESGDTMAYFGEEITLGKTNGSAQANFSAAGLQFKNETGDTIAKMLSTDAQIGTITVEEKFASSVRDNLPISGTFYVMTPTSYTLPNAVFDSAENFIHYSIEIGKFAIFDVRDTNHDGLYPWYHLDNNSTVYTIRVGETGAMTGARIFGTIVYGDTLPRYISASATLVKDEIVNGQRTYTNIQTVDLVYVINYSAETSKISVSIYVSGLPSSIINSNYTISGWGFGDISIGQTYTTINYQTSAGYAPEYVFGLKKAGQTAQAYAFIGGEQNYANSQHQAVFGKFNDPNSNHAFEIGNGTDDNNRSNAFAVDWNGNVDANNLVTDVAYDSTNEKFTLTIGGTTSDIVTLTTLASALRFLIVGLTGKGAITDFDDTTTSGFYTYASSATSRPPINAGGACLVLHSSSAFITQICFPNRSSSTAAPTFYIRRSYSAGNWQAWYQIVPTST